MPVPAMFVSGPGNGVELVVHGEPPRPGDAGSSPGCQSAHSHQGDNGGPRPAQIAQVGPGP
eukprot:14846043-Heterocapsa_arctica.AAC.1